MRSIRNLIADQRRRGAFILAVLVCGVPMLSGCAEPPDAVAERERPPGLTELGKPWPVLAGSFNGPITAIGHDQRGFLFQVGRTGGAVYFLDYRHKRVDRLPARQPAASPRLLIGADGASLEFVSPQGTVLELSKSLPPAAYRAYALAPDGIGAAFYEQNGGALQLVYADLGAGTRSVWRRTWTAPASIRLAWSPDGGHLLEESGGRLVVYDRAAGRMAVSVPGQTPVFSPDGSFLAYRLPNGRAGIVDLRAGSSWPLPAPDKDYLPLPAMVWSPDGARLFQQAVRAKEAKRPGSPYLLCLYIPAAGAFRAYPQDRSFDFRRLMPLLQAPLDRIGQLIRLAYQAQAVSPTALPSGKGFLAGRENQLVLIDPEARLFPIQEFPGRISGLSLSGGNRLVFWTGGAKSKLYAWRLPDPAFLTGVFPAGGDLNLGPFRLGASAAETPGALGRPIGVETRPDPLQPGEKLEIVRYPGTTLTYAQGRLVRIICTSSNLATGRGLGIGAPASDLLERYGRPDFQKAGYYSYHGRAEGIAFKVAFQLDADRLVAGVLLAETDRGGGKPGEAPSK